MSHDAPNTGPMITARRAAAAAKHDAVLAALTELTRTHRPITLTSVAARAGVSRRYLSQHPTLGPRIRRAAASPAVAAVADPATGIEAALRHHIRTLTAQHEATVKDLRRRMHELEQQNARLRGALIQTGTSAPVVPTPSSP